MLKPNVKTVLVSALVVMALLQVVVLTQGTLSEQVLQLLTRNNTWSGQNSFQNLRVPVGALPADTLARIYTDPSGNLYYNGGLIAGSGGGAVPHNLLSTTHPDTLAASPPTAGDLIVANSTPKWARFAKGSDGTFLLMVSGAPAWSTSAATLTALNATQLTSGTVPIARISGLLNAQVDAAAAIGWTKISKTGSSLADLTTVSASDISSGTLADARLSANVSLFGTTVDTSEIASGAVTAIKIADFGCTAGQAATWQLSGWTCGTFGTGSGTVTSVALSLPGIFSVSGSPVTTTGTLSATLATQTANMVWAGPGTGAAASPTFRSLVNADLPTSGVAAGTYAKVTLNTRGVATAASAQITLTTDVSGILPLANGGTGLSSAADDTTVVSSGTAWVATTLPSCTGGALAYNQTTNTFSCVTSPTFVTGTFTSVVTAGITVGTGGAAYTKVTSGTATWDPSSISDGDAGTTTLTVTGAVSGDVCTASLTTLTTDALAIAAYPSAADTVRVVLNNNTGSPVDITSGTLRAACWHFS